MLEGKGEWKAREGRGRAQVLGVIGLGQAGEERRECSLLVDLAARGGRSCFGEAGVLCGVGERVRCWGRGVMGTGGLRSVEEVETTLCHMAE